MRRSRFGWCVVVGVAAVLLARVPAAANNEAFAGRGVGVTSVGCPEGTAAKAGELLIAALPRFAEAMPLRLPAGEQVTVHLFGTAEGYGEAVKAAGAPELVDNHAATVNSTKECYLVLEPRAEAAALDAAGGIPEMTRWLLFHEVVHQITYRADPAAQNWPDWYAEGMAEHVAKRLVRASAPAGAPPSIVEQDKAHRALDALETGRFPTLSQLLRTRQVETTSGRRPLYYAAWGALYELLSKDAARFSALHARIRSLSEGDEKRSVRQREEEFAAALEAAYGPSADLEKRLVAAVRAATPEWFEGVRSTQRVGDSWLCTAFPDSRAYLLRAKPAPGVPYRLSTDWTLHDIGMRQMEIYLAYQSREYPRFLKVALRCDGNATLLAYAEGNWIERYRTNANVEPALLAAGTPHKTTIDVDAKTLRVEVDGKPVLETAPPLGFDVLGGCVGFGVSNGLATFRRFEVTPRK